ncbi:hypothetical protein [Cryobacterium sp. Y50]|uniref:hypothetical protein n=1 Tax=Cryobacterium sp. Y50 TaxID=2048286 RepID=UPI0018ECF541|nr:hypothetical protein [Cryobacterium sp. Y50]
MLHAGRHQPVIARVAHRVHAGAEAFLRFDGFRIRSGDAALHQLPGRRHVGRVHEAVHHEGLEAEPLGPGSPQNAADTAGPADYPPQQPHQRRNVAGVDGEGADDLDGEDAHGYVAEDHAAEVVEETVPGGEVLGLSGVEQRREHAPGPQADRGSIAARVTELSGLPRQLLPGPLLDALPDRVDGDVVKVFLPATVIPNERRWLERHHVVGHLQHIAGDRANLVHVGRCDRHVARKVGAHPVVSFEIDEHPGEFFAEWIQLHLRTRPHRAASATHQRIEVRGERDLRESGIALLVQHDVEQVLVVEISVGHRHRFPAVPAHGQQCRRMVGRGQQADLVADELCVRAGAADTTEVLHLLGDPGDGVVAVDAHLVGIRCVVTRRAGRVAFEEDSVGTLTADR